MPRAYDVFLSHCGAEDGLVKKLLDYVRQDLQGLQPIGGSDVICAFRDEDDLDGIDLVKDALLAAILQAPIGTH